MLNATESHHVESRFMELGTQVFRPEQRIEHREFTFGGSCPYWSGHAGVHGIEDGGRCVRYTPCAPAHHHHLVCRSCGAVEDFDLAGLNTKLARIATARGYAALGHTLEVAGICSACRGRHA